MTRRGRVQPGEWRWVAAWIVAALLVSSIPYALGALLSTPDRVFGGAVLAVEDVNSYFAKMRQGAEGEWLFHIVYTSEPHDGALFFMFHLLLGKAAALTGMSLEAAYHVARLVFGGALLVTLYRFFAEVSGSRALRRIAFLLALFAGGLGWMLMLSAQPNWLGSPPLDLILPEGFTFLVVYAMPHIALARTLLLAGLLLVWRAGGDWPAGLLAGLCWAAMALIVPFYVAVVYAVVAAAWVAASWRRAIDRREARRTVVACALAAVVPAFSALVFATNPIFAAWSRQNLILSPHPLHYVLAYGAVGLLALWSLRWAWRRRAWWRRLAAWLVVIPLLLYVPFALQRRLVEAWQVPLSMLAAVTLARVVLPAVRKSRPVRWLTRRPRYTSGGMQRLALNGFAVIMTLTFILLLVDQSLRVLSREWPMFHSGGEIAALDWLNGRATYRDVVLSAYDTGNYLPARVSARAYIGHGPETVNLADKRPLAARFYSRDGDDGWREAFLREAGITYVLAGPFERALGQADLAGRPYLERVYDAGGYEIYRVSGAP